MSDGIRVRVIRPGFIHNELKPVGSEFTLSNPEGFSKVWMQKIDPEPDEDDEIVDGELEAVASTRRRRRIAQ